MLRSIALLALAALSCRAQDASALFEFHNGFWLNLHQFLYTGQAAKASQSPAWQEAVAYYRKQIIPQNTLGADLVEFNNRLSAAASETSLPSDGLDPALIEALTKAAPTYRSQFWPAHQRSNEAWIAAVRPLLAKYGASMSKEIASAWQTHWPSAPIRVDVSAFAGENGAYTTVDPAHITINSTDAAYQGPGALEMLFHEASHTLDENVRQALSSELKARNLLLHRRTFSHAILFYTAGEIAKRHLPDYQPFAIRYGILERGWPGSVAILEKDWKPYLEHQATLAEAVTATVTDYSEPKPR